MVATMVEMVAQGAVRTSDAPDGHMARSSCRILVTAHPAGNASGSRVLTQNQTEFLREELNEIRIK